MRIITPIQSFSDIITNSSSEVFLMGKDNANYFSKLDADGCISVSPINSLEDITRYYWCYEDLICDYLSESWDTIISDEKYYNQLIGLCIVDIEDHFQDCEYVYDKARNVCLSSLWNH